MQVVVGAPSLRKLDMIYTDNVHLISDTSLDELHKFASSVNIKRCWYHSSSKWKHYDIPKRMRKDFARDHGVRLVTSREIVTILKRGPSSVE